MDFTIKTYQKLLQAFLQKEYSLISYQEYLTNNENSKILILRHDVDEKADNALRMAQTEHKLGVKATYYFRIVKQSNRPEIIKAIAKLGHEIGYHYEDLADAEGDMKFARKTFEENLAYFRTYYPVKTVSMHGSSASKYDNRIFFAEYKLEEFNLLGEPYLSTDFNKVFYLTDTGHSWDGHKYAVWDVVENRFGLTYHSSDDIIKAVEKDEFPSQCLMLAHTLWSDNIVQWTLLHLREFLRNNFKYLAQRNKFLKKIYAKMVKVYWKK